MSSPRFSVLPAALLVGLLTAAPDPAAAANITDILKKHGSEEVGGSPPVAKKQEEEKKVAPTIAKKSSQDDLTDECDRLTAADFDQDLPRGVKRVFFDDIDVGRAVPACEAAKAAHPEDRRMLFQLGRAYDAAGRHREARELFEAAVALGSTAAMNGMGNQYHRGWAGPVDFDEAMRWFEKAAARGSPRAMANLGIMFMNGDGRRPDPDKAAAHMIRSMQAKGEDIFSDMLERSSTYARTYTRPVIVRLQRFLIREGFLDGNPDGSVGPATRRAFQAYRASLMPN